MRESKFPVCAVNIAAHAHPQGTYERLMRAAMDERVPLPIYGDRHALMVGLDDSRELSMSGRRVLRGRLATFLDLDMEASWFNLDQLRVISDDERREIHIPESHRPNMAEFHFVFDPQMHILICQAATVIEGKRRRLIKLTGLMLASFIGQLLHQPKIRREFGQIEVTPVPDRNSVDSILRGAIRKLHITLRTPNPDDLDELQGQIKRRMKRLHARQIDEIVTANDDEQLTLDSKLVNKARVAALNGSVVAKVIQPNGRVVDVSTKDRPALFEISRSAKETDERATDRAAEFALNQIQAFKAQANHRSAPTKRGRRSKN